MEYLRSACYFLIVLSALVIAHEWGHFIVAKFCQMRVDDFSLFFGPKIVQLGKHNGTEYNIRLIPLGGFVKIAGMEPEDLSHNESLFRKIDPGSSTTSKEFLRQMREAHKSTLAEVNFDQVTDRVAEVVATSIGPNAHLTQDGKEDLASLLTSTGINEEEHKYIEAMLAADNYVPDPDGYNQKPLWQRAAVIFAGPFVSLAFGYLLFCVMGFTVGLPYEEVYKNVIESVVKGKPAYRQGMRPGDQIVKIDAETIADGKKMVEIIHGSAGKPLHFVVMRDNHPMAFTITPEKSSGPGKPTGLIGILPAGRLVWKLYSPAKAVQVGTRFIYNQIYGTLHIFASGSLNTIGENSSGIVGIAQHIHQDSKEGPRQVLLTAAMLSVGLGILNLFPIPILDGGHLLLLGIEGIRRRKLSSREVYAAQLVGISIIGMLFVFVMYNDIQRMIMH